MREPLILAKGKTKIIRPHTVAIESNNMLTAGNGARKVEMPGKAMWATETTCNVFEFLERNKVPVAYKRRLNPTTFEALWTEMLPFEVVGRFIAVPTGSYVKRNPDVVPGSKLNPMVVELFLKTSDGVFAGIPVPTDDPYVSSFTADGVVVHSPSVPVSGNGVFIPASALGWEQGREHQDLMNLRYIRMLTRKVGVLMQEAWEILGYQLADFKIEFGVTSTGRVVVSDVYDNDSQRLLDEEGVDRSKQRFRNGDPISEVAKDYATIAQVSQQLLVLV